MSVKSTDDYRNDTYHSLSEALHCDKSGLKAWLEWVDGPSMSCQGCVIVDRLFDCLALVGSTIESVNSAKRSV